MGLRRTRDDMTTQPIKSRSDEDLKETQHPQPHASGWWRQSVPWREETDRNTSTTREFVQQEQSQDVVVRSNPFSNSMLRRCSPRTNTQTCCFLFPASWRLNPRRRNPLWPRSASLHWGAAEGATRIRTRVDFYSETASHSTTTPPPQRTV